jgi:CHAD domain-containing protein
VEAEGARVGAIFRSRFPDSRIRESRSEDRSYKKHRRDTGIPVNHTLAINLTVTTLDAEPDRFLLQTGKRPEKVLNRLFRGVHLAGFVVVPHPADAMTERTFGRAAGAVTTPSADDGPAPGVTRATRRFDLEHRDYPKGLVALDTARLQYTGRDPVEAFEIAVELRQGPQLLLDRVRAIVGLEPSFIPARMTDAERAVLIASPRAPQPRSAPGSHLTLESRWQDLGLAHLKALAAQLQQHEPRAWESLEPEGVHQMRVTARRLREALRTFGPVLPAAETAALALELRWLTGLLGTVRDLDVQLERLANEANGNGGEPALDGYRRHLRKRQRVAHRALVDGLADPRYLEIGRSLQALVTAALAVPPTSADPTIAAAGAEALRRQLRRVRRAGRWAAHQCAPLDLHRLRIRAKRLRYFLEYVQPVGGPGITAGIAALSDLQDILGEHQDACVAHTDLRRYRESAQLTRRERKVLRRLIEHEAARVEAARAQFRTVWPAFAEASRALVLC